MTPLSALVEPREKVDNLSTWRYVVLLSATVLAPYQLYLIPAANTYFPLALICAFACLPFIAFRRFDRPLAFIGFSYFLLMCFSVTWSPDKGSWATNVLYGFLMLIGFFAARSFAGPNALRSVLHWFLVVSSVNGVLVVLFRVATGLKEAYLASSLLSLFKNPKLVANLEVFRPNVFDPDKSGGFYDNANTGAAFSLLCIGVAISTFGYRSKVLSAYFFVVFSLAVVFSGSKSALMIYVAAMVIFGLCAVILKIGNPYLRIAALAFSAVGAILLAGLLMLAGNAIESSSFGEGVRSTSEERLLLWRIARIVFFQHPIRGLGFGGWGEVLSNYAATGVNVYLPPHNSLIMAWAECGLIAVVLCLSLWFVFAHRLLRSIRSARNSLEPAGALFAMCCVSGMSLGDTFPLFGYQTMTVPLGVLLALGLMYDSKDPARLETSGEQRQGPSV